MEEYNKNTISYDEGWQTVSEPEYRTPYTQDYGANYGNMSYENETDEILPEKDGEKQKHAPKQLLITIQLIACIIVAIVMCSIKLLGGQLYSDVRAWFKSEMSNSVIITSNDKQIDLSKFLGSSADEVSSK